MAALLFVPLTPETRHLIIGGITQILELAQGEHYPVEEAIDALEVDLETGERLVALLQPEVDDDVRLLRTVLDPGPREGEGKRVELSMEADWAFDRVTTRILAAWHGNDPLAKFLYRGR